nr:hypothetical protein [Nannocystis exedens]
MARGAASPGRGAPGKRSTARSRSKARPPSSVSRPGAALRSASRGLARARSGPRRLGTSLRPEAVQERLEQPRLCVRGGDALPGDGGPGAVHHRFEDVPEELARDVAADDALADRLVEQRGDAGVDLFRGARQLGIIEQLGGDEQEVRPVTRLDEDLEEVLQARADRPADELGLAEPPTRTDLLRAAGLRALDELRALPRWLRDVLGRGLHVDPARRFPDMPALLAALLHDPQTARRRWLRVAGLSALVVAAAVLLGFAVVASALGRRNRTAPARPGRSPWRRLAWRRPARSRPPERGRRRRRARCRA